jgi:hypothetical protein
LIVDAGDPEASANLADLLVRGSWQIERRAMEQVRPHDLCRSGSLIVAVAVSQANRGTQLWDWLRHNPIPMPALAVLPETVDSETLRIATQAVDDFVLWPVRSEEIQYRVTGLLGGFVPDTSWPMTATANLRGPRIWLAATRDSRKLFANFLLSERAKPPC